MKLGIRRKGRWSPVAGPKWQQFGAQGAAFVPSPLGRVTVADGVTTDTRKFGPVFVRKTDAYGTKYFHVGIGRFGFGFREVAPKVMVSVLNADGNWVRRWNSWATSKLGGWGVGFVELHGVNYKVVTAFGRTKIYKERVRETFKERMERKLMRSRKKSEQVSGREFEKQYTRLSKRAKHGPIGRGGGGKW